jgi:16S rRNA (uracil1498-N3)-methyltransferase
MRRRFFVDRFQGDFAVLRGNAAHHLVRVLRAEPGQIYELSDGESLRLGRTENVSPDAVDFSLLESLPVCPSSLRIKLLLAIVKFDRFEWAIAKATELGVDDIVPLAAERSEKGLIAASEKRATRWNKLLFEAAQQSRRMRVPILRDAVNPRVGFREVTAQIKLLLSERAESSPMRDLLEPGAATIRSGNATSVAVAIGPEGGWTDGEFAAGVSAGFAETALGINILRTETAVCAALAAVQYASGAFRHSSEIENPQAEAREK